MTPKQAERIRNKVKKIKAGLAADKRQWGGFYDDSAGMRYLPPQYYIQLQDYTGGLRYFNWFNKNFPDDCGFPDFLFEWVIVLFKRGRIKEAEKKAFETFCSNVYLFDKFFGNPIVPIDKYEFSNTDQPEFTEYLEYSSEQEELKDFSEWLREYINSEKSLKASTEYIQIYKLLKDEEDTSRRKFLINQARHLMKTF